jgi:hypothetical protein
LADHAERLLAAIETLSEEVRVLRDAIDELRDEFTWAVRNREPPPPVSPFVPLTSLPRDPLAADFGERINRVGAQDVLADDATPHSPGRLF